MCEVNAKKITTLVIRSRTSKPGPSEGSNMQTVTLLMFIYSYVAYAWCECGVNVSTKLAPRFKMWSGHRGTNQRWVPDAGGELVGRRWTDGG